MLVHCQQPLALSEYFILYLGKPTRYLVYLFSVVKALEYVV